MAGPNIIVWGSPKSLEFIAAKSFVGNLILRIAALRSKEELEALVVDTKRSLENNLSGIASSNLRASMLGMWSGWEFNPGISETLFNILYSSLLREISIETEGGSEWARGEAPAKDASQMLKVLRMDVDKGTEMEARKFNFQGYEFVSEHSAACLYELVNINGTMFPPGTWTKLQDLSLVYFDWTWTVMGEITQENVRIYYTKMTSLFSAIGNNLPNLGKLELTHSWILRDDIYLWLFCQDPPAQFSDLLSEEEWRDGRLGWHKEKKRFLPRITAAATSINRRCQMHLDTVLKKKVELTPLARSLTFLSIHNATERIDASTAVIAWCTSLRHLDLTDFDIVTDVRKVSPEHYRRGFCLPSVHRIYNLTGQPTALAVAAIQQPDSETMTRLWKGYNESLPAEGRLEFILKSLVLGAPKLQDLYIGVDSRQTVNGMDHVKLSSSHIQQLLSFKSLNILELENVDPASCMMCLEALSIQLKKVTITNVLINFARILSSMPQIREIILRNTNAVLYDDVDENQIVEFDGNPPLQRRLQRLSIEYTVPLTLVEYIFSKLPDLEYLALGHGSHRYSSRGSISRLTPPTWKYLLRTSNLTQLRTLSIPVLYQPGLHPDTQISILDYDDMVDLFKYLPSLEKAHVHRRDYSRFGDQPSFPQYMITDPRYSFIHPGDF